MFWLSIIFASFLLVAAIVIFSLRIGFPYHRGIGIVVYLLGWIPFMYSLLLVEDWVFQGGSIVENIFSPLFGQSLFFIILSVTFLILYKIFLHKHVSPTQKNQEKDKAEMNQDLLALRYLDNKITRVLSRFEDTGFFSYTFIDTTKEERAIVRSLWSEYLDALFEIELIYNEYNSFHIWNLFRYKGARVYLFVNRYSALVMRHYSVLTFIQKTQDEGFVTYLNQPIPGENIPANTYSKLKESIGNPYTIMQIAEGRMCYFLLKKIHKINYGLLDKHLDALKTSIKTHSALLMKRPLDFFEQQSSKIWSPVIKSTALGVSYIRTTDRPYHITQEQIRSMRKLLQPGDVLLERREWHAINVGIPGFWTHAALFFGELPELDELFKDCNKLEGKTFSEYLAIQYEHVYESIIQGDESGNSYVLIEAKRPGVVLESLEVSASVDSLAVLRLRDVSASQMLTVILEALSNLGRPYDYEFDFTTDNAFVCSELVYKAYKMINRFTLELQVLNGRPMASPNDIAKKFGQEYGKSNQELELLLFLDGNEKEGVAQEASIDEFLKTATRPKWNAARQLVRRD